MLSSATQGTQEVMLNSFMTSPKHAMIQSRDLRPLRNSRNTLMMREGPLIAVCSFNVNIWFSADKQM